MAKKSKSTVNKAGNYTKPGMRKKFLIVLKHRRHTEPLQDSGQLVRPRL